MSYPPSWCSADPWRTKRRVETWTWAEARASASWVLVRQALLEKPVRHLAIDIEHLAGSSALPSQERHAGRGAHAERDREHRFAEACRRRKQDAARRGEPMPQQRIRRRGGAIGMLAQVAWVGWRTAGRETGPLSPCPRLSAARRRPPAGTPPTTAARETPQDRAADCSSTLPHEAGRWHVSGRPGRPSKVTGSTRLRVEGSSNPRQGTEEPGRHSRRFCRGAQ